MEASVSADWMYKLQLDKPNPVKLQKDRGFVVFRYTVAALFMFRSNGFSNVMSPSR
jgi:hypothetical protein